MKEEGIEKIKWVMNTYTNFTGTKNGYRIELNAGKPNTWFIYKGDELVDHCYKYPPMNEEANGKVQSEKVLNTHLNHPL